MIYNLVYNVNRHTLNFSVLYNHQQRTSNPDAEPGEREESMNRARRKRLSEALDLILQAKDILDEVKDEEQEAFDNLPENFQYGERGEQMEEYISDIEEAFDNLEEAEGLISEI